ncbi:MAG: WYL domain-containing protein [Ilumatobacteraceae bacterium]
MAEPLERLTNLLALLLETKQPLTLQQISGELAGHYPLGEVALRGAFERDKTVLRNVGVPIDQTVLGGDQAGQTGYWIDRRRYELSDLELADDERQALQLAVAAVRSDESWGQEGLWKLGGGSERPSRAVAATVPTFASLPALREAVASRAPVSFGYRDKPRVLDPYGLLLRDGYWYVIGVDHAHAEVRTFRVDRIDGGVEAGIAGSFERPVDFDIRTVFPTDPKLLGEPENQIRTAIVRIEASHAPIVASEVGETAIVEHRRDGSIDVEVPCVNRDAFRSWVLGMAEHAVVISPAEVRADLVAWLTDLVEMGS